MNQLYWPLHAYNCFIKTGIDILVLDNFIVKNPNSQHFDGSAYLLHIGKTGATLDEILSTQKKSLSYQGKSLIDSVYMQESFRV